MVERNSIHYYTTLTDIVDMCNLLRVVYCEACHLPCTQKLMLLALNSIQLVEGCLDVYAYNFYNICTN